MVAHIGHHTIWYYIPYIISCLLSYYSHMCINDWDFPIAHKLAHGAITIKDTEWMKFRAMKQGIFKLTNSIT